MPFYLSPIGNTHFIDNNGNPRVGAKLFTYIVNTATKTPVFKDVLGLAQHTNPIILSADGTVPNEIWLSGGEIYKFVLAPPTDTDPPTSPIRSWDNIKGFNDVSHKPQLVNVLFNGNLNVWQAGTSFTGITTTQNVADEWFFNVASQGTWTVAQNADVPTVTQAGRNLNFSIRATVTTPDATTNVADNVHIRAAVEGFNYAPLFEQTQTIRFWAKSNLTGTYCVSLRNVSPSDRSYVQTFTIDAANTWELKTITITGAPGIGGTWNFQTGVGAYLSFALAAGTNFQTLAGLWSAGNFIATSAQVNLAATTSNYFALADVRLVPGSDASNIIIPTFSEQLAIAQRYYEKSFQYATAPVQNVGSHTGCAFFTQIVGAATQQFGSRIGFKVRKRAIPSVVTTFNPFAANAQARNATIGVDCSGTVTDNLSEEGCHIFFTTPAGSAAGQAIAVHWTSDSRL